MSRRPICLAAALACLTAGCGTTRRGGSSRPAPGAKVASCAREPLAPAPQPGQGVYRAGPLTLVVGEDVGALPRRRLVRPAGVEAIAVLAGASAATLSVDRRYRSRLALQFTPLFPGHRNAVMSDGRSAVRFPACGQQVHRFGGGILFVRGGEVRLHVHVAGRSIPMVIPVGHPSRRTRSVDPPLRALVTDQTENRLLVVSLPGAKVLRQVTIPGSPGYVDAAGHLAVVVSSGPGAVTLLDQRTLHTVRVFPGLVSPHIPAVSPDGHYAYVTDDASGELAVIRLADRHLTSAVSVGVGAHHLAFSPNERQVWVALSQSARTITVLSTAPHPRSPLVDLGHPRVVGHFVPGFLAHDLLFSPDGRRVWITSASTSSVGVFSASTRRLLFRVQSGPPPQHLVFVGGVVYITSGYGSSIEEVDAASGRVLKRTSAPYGSFDLDARGRYVVTASLLRGTLAVYNRRLRLLRVRQLAPSAEDVALSPGQRIGP